MRASGMAMMLLQRGALVVRREPRGCYERRALAEGLEGRRLLAIAAAPAVAAVHRDDAAATVMPAARQPSSPGARVVAASGAAGVAAHVDAAAVRADLLRLADTWNGGQLGAKGTSGMGTYSPTWDGLFRTNLDRQFNRIHYYTDDQTIISQSRAIYMNVEAYRAASAADQPRFRAAVQKGADYLLSHAVDPATYNGNPGGMWWGLQNDGVSPPTHTTPIYGPLPRSKDAYGQVQSLFALAEAFSVTGDARFLTGAFTQLNVWNTQFADTAAGPGAFLPAANENYTQRVDTRNLDYMTHALEALLTLSDVTPMADPRRAQLAVQITNLGNFITTRMYRDAAGSTTMGYLPWYYDAQWNPSSDPAQRYMTPGHNVEVAFLLSRAVERGFNASWLTVANKLVAFALRYGYDDVPTSPTYGAMKYEKLNFNGTPFGTAAQNLIWWQSAEAARMLLHFATVRGRTDLWDEYDATMAFIRAHFVDPTYGGWFTSLNPTTLAPTTTDKGTVWTGGYHETMLYAEMLRLAGTQQTPFSGTPIAIPAAGAAVIQAEDFDNGGEGVAYHDVDAANNGGKYRSTGVDIESTTDAGGGYNVGWTRAGEWLEYTVNVAKAGTYAADFRVASNSGGSTFHLEVDGKDATGPMTVPNTAGWQKWTTITRRGISLPAGQHVLRLAMDTAGPVGSVGNFNWFRIAPSAVPVTIATNTSAHVRDGSYANINYGSSPTLEVKKNNAGFNREAYLKFDLSSVATISSAKLRLFGRLLDAQNPSMSMAVFGAANTSWNESTLTWNTRPASGPQVAALTISGTTSKWYEVDLTSYLKAEKAAGRNLVTLVLKSTQVTNVVCTFNSDEAGATGPQLVIAP